MFFHIFIWENLPNPKLTKFKSRSSQFQTLFSHSMKFEIKKYYSFYLYLYVKPSFSLLYHWYAEI